MVILKYTKLHGGNIKMANEAIELYKMVEISFQENKKLHEKIQKLEAENKELKLYCRQVQDEHITKKELCEFHYESITTCDSSSCNISPDYCEHGNSPDEACDSSSCNISPDYCKHHNDLNYDKCDDCDYETEQEIIATRKRTDYLKNRNNFLADYSEKFEAAQNKRRSA
jgi:hypothetical protein